MTVHHKIMEMEAASGATSTVAVAWSDVRVHCDPFGSLGHLELTLGEELPLVWDETGSGCWSVDDIGQCGCGRIIAAPAALVVDPDDGDVEKLIASVQEAEEQYVEDTMRRLYRSLRRMIDDVEDPEELPTPCGLDDDPGVSFDPDTGEMCAGVTINFGPGRYGEPGADVRYVTVTKHADGYTEDWWWVP